MAHINIAEKKIEHKGRWLFWIIFAVTGPMLTAIAIALGIFFDYRAYSEEYPALLEAFQNGTYYPKPRVPSFPMAGIIASICVGAFVAVIILLIMLHHRNKSLYGDKDAVIFNEGRRLLWVATEHGVVTAFISDIVSVEAIETVTPTAKKEGEEVEPTYGKIVFSMRGRKGPYTITSIKVNNIFVVMDKIEEIRYPNKAKKASA